ncbi:hypothetical protein B2M26_13815 [Ferroacidibacillus organovorans]|uniref:Uncharacterized protein n=1 Tax=Ferroacidibacillus organovorans TaxID=1765683 RepID=A0A1V4EQN2_9BACL|nr:hypothetical protein B2M26_13815 [Ferroacidibacillus organovorans]
MAYRQTSPGKNVAFLSIYPLHLLSTAFGSMGFVLLCRLTQLLLASIEVRDPRVGDLPPPSFRFHLAMDTLGLS